MAASPEDRFANINGLRLHYLDWGGPSENFLLLLHGISGNAHSWDDFAGRVCDDFRVFSLDQRGHGDSEHAREGYPVAAFASDIFGLTMALGIEQFDLVGASLGARNAMPYAAEHSASLKHLVFVDFGPEIERAGARNVMAGVGGQRPLGFRNREEARGYFLQRNPASSSESIEHSINHSLRLNWADKLVWKHDPELLWITGSAGAREVPFLWESCAKITCPTLIMRGETSNILGRATMEKMVVTIPNARAIEIAGAGHSIHLDQPDEFERTVRDFLTS